ncbi:hypothetical protein GGC64_006328 [Mycobacterium sp. OAS707]|nr:hypothetical protein [Mycobacterium sp. OAS707]
MPLAVADFAMAAARAVANTCSICDHISKD